MYREVDVLRKGTGREEENVERVKKGGKLGDGAIMKGDMDGGCFGDVQWPD